MTKMGEMAEVANKIHAPGDEHWAAIIVIRQIQLRQQGRFVWRPGTVEPGQGRLAGLAIVLDSGLPSRGRSLDAARPSRPGSRHHRRAGPLVVTNVVAVASGKVRPPPSQLRTN